MSQLNQAEAAASAAHTRKRLIEAMAAAYAECYKIPPEQVVLQENRRLDPDGTLTVSYFFTDGAKEEHAELDSDLALAGYFKAAGWRWAPDGALMRPCGNCKAECPKNGLCHCGCDSCDGRGEFVEVAAAEQVPVGETETPS